MWSPFPRFICVQGVDVRDFEAIASQETRKYENSNQWNAFSKRNSLYFHVRRLGFYIELICCKMLLFGVKHHKYPRGYRSFESPVECHSRGSRMMCITSLLKSSHFNICGPSYRSTFHNISYEHIKCVLLVSTIINVYTWLTKIYMYISLFVIVGYACISTQSPTKWT